ncbi:MAG: hypothetical protein M5U35_06745 [Roseovarius sp.]|nr:hypothetical protein [Roseovarius sp.]
MIIMAQSETSTLTPNEAMPIGPEFRDAHEDTTALIVDLKSLLFAMEATELMATDVLRASLAATEAGAVLINLLSRAREKLADLDRHHNAEWDAHHRERRAVTT